MPKVPNHLPRVDDLPAGQFRFVSIKNLEQQYPPSPQPTLHKPPLLHLPPAFFKHFRGESSVA